MWAFIFYERKANLQNQQPSQGHLKCLCEAPATIAEHIVQASLWLVWGKQERPSFTKEIKNTGTLKHLITTVFFSRPLEVWGWEIYLDIPNMPLCWGHPTAKTDSWTGPECGGGESWLHLHSSVSESAALEPLDLRHWSRQHPRKDIMLSCHCSGPSTKGTGKMLYLPKRNMACFSNYELLMSLTVSSTRALAKQGEQMHRCRRLEQPRHHSGTWQRDSVRTAAAFPAVGLAIVHIYWGDKYHPTPILTIHYIYVNF